MSARDLIRRYVSLLGDVRTPRATTDARVEQVYAAVRAEVLHEAGKDTRKGESTRVASPWQQAVDGLNALVDAGIAVHVEPDGHIAKPLGDEHIEWDRASQRWRLVHDDEAEGGAPPVAERQLTKDNVGGIDDWLDRVDVFAKPYIETVDGRLTVVGIRIGPRPDHVVARFGDTIVRHADGTHTVRHAETAITHRFEPERLGVSDAKRRLARCKHCGQDRTDAVHARTTAAEGGER